MTHHIDASPKRGITVRHYPAFPEVTDVYAGGWRVGRYKTAEGVQQAIARCHVDYGWCEAPSHPRHDHMLNVRCENPVTDAEHTARLTAEAAEHDRHNEGRIEASYVATHRPY